VTVVSPGDGLDSNGSITFSGGVTTVSGPTSGGGQGSVDSNGAITVDGGEVSVAGSVLKTATGSQAWVAATVSGSTGQKVEIMDAAGTVIGSFTAGDDFGAVFYSGPDVTADGTYSVSVDGGTPVSVSAGVAVQSEMGGPGGGGMPGRQP